MTWQRALRATVPYWLLLPVLVAIVAILGYPLYKLVVLSFQQYGLAELIQHKGVWVGIANYASVLHDPVFWHTLLRTVVFTIANVGLTIGIGTFLALLLVRVSSAVRILLTAGLVLVWSMPVVVAVQVWYWITNYQNGILNYALTRLHLGDYELARLVRDDLLEARDGDAPDRLGSAPVRHDHASTPGSRRCRASSSRRPRSTAPGRCASSATSPSRS